MRAGWGWGVVLSVLVYRSSATSLRYTLDLFLIHMRPTTCLCSSLVFQVLKIENLQVYHQRKRPSDALTEEKTKERKKKYDQETRKRSFQESWEKIVNGWFTMKKKNTMHFQWCMDYAADSDKKSAFAAGCSSFRYDSVVAHQKSYICSYFY